MPYYNPYSNAYGNPYGNSYYNNSYLPQQNSTQQFMINVDGEMAARAWQMPNNLPPNTVIPLWDLDGQHVYFRSIDAYGRMNPIRKGRVVFDEPAQNLQQGNPSEQNVSEAVQNPEKYMTVEEFRNEMDRLKNDIREMMQPVTTVQHTQNRGNKT